MLAPQHLNAHPLWVGSGHILEMKCLELSPLLFKRMKQISILESRAALVRKGQDSHKKKRRPRGRRSSLHALDGDYRTTNTTAVRAGTVKRPLARS